VAGKPLGDGTTYKLAISDFLASTV